MLALAGPYHRCSRCVRDDIRPGNLSGSGCKTGYWGAAFRIWCGQRLDDTVIAYRRDHDNRHHFGRTRPGPRRQGTEQLQYPGCPAAPGLRYHAPGPTLVGFVRHWRELLAYYLTHFLPLSDWTGREDEAWYKSWTVFYWAWWISWSPFVGVFIARISRGRSVREFVTAVSAVADTGQRDMDVCLRRHCPGPGAARHRRTGRRYHRSFPGACSICWKTCRLPSLHHCWP